MNIDYAQAKDVPHLHGLHGNLVGVKFRWSDRLGRGGDLNTPLALVAREKGKIVGYLGWGPFVLTLHTPGGPVPIGPSEQLPWT